MELTEAEQEKIKGYGKTCKALADKGAAFNLHEAHMFEQSIKWLDFDVCDALIKTLKSRAKS